MQLSEAIRLGAMLRHKVRFIFFEGDGSCALGAAYEAMTNSSHIDTRINTFLMKQWPQLTRRVRCPECGERAILFEVIGTHLNDKHDWPRLAIADFIATLEPHEVAQQPVEAVEEEVGV